MTDLSDVKALVFDVFGTVVDWRNSVIFELSDFFAARGFEADWPDFVDRWKACYRPGMDEIVRGERPWRSVHDIYREALTGLLADFGAPPLDENEAEFVTDAWYRLDPWPDAVGGLTRLRTRFALSTLSNADFAGMVAMSKRAGLPWDCVLTADVVQTYKPDPKVYQMAIRLLGGEEPAKVMLVAAHNYDLAEAQSHGMRTAFIPRTNEYGPAQTTDLAPIGDWDLIAEDLEDLAQRLGC
ncbi:MAG: haloacid dehalogenase type II [Alphaproteobacteria bacterium]|nr:haloacid dehalogenase type II [Alphaproteobacteria bacterium]